MKHLQVFETFNDKEFKVSEVPFAVAHHFGNPLDAIDSFVNLAIKFLERGNVEKAKECLVDASSTIEKAKQVLDDFRKERIKFVKESILLESLKFNKQPKKSGAKTDVYNVSKSGKVVGQVKWSSRMRGYAFLPTPDCESEIKEFVKDLMAKRRAEKKKKK